MPEITADTMNCQRAAQILTVAVADRHLLATDRRDLKKLAALIEVGAIEKAVRHARSMDTAVREEVPRDVWEWMLTVTDAMRILGRSGFHVTLKPTTG